MGLIDVGSGATDLGDINDESGTSLIDIGNAANDTGTITSFQVRTWDTLTGFKIALFYNTGVGLYTCRSVAELGDIGGGGGLFTITQDRFAANLALSVVTGDLLAIYYTASSFINSKTTGGVGLYAAGGDKLTSTLESVFNLVTQIDWQLSIYATGTTGGDIPAIPLGFYRQTYG